MLYPEHGNPGLDVLHHTLRLDWKPDQKLLSGTAVARIRPVVPATEISLDFTGLTVDTVTVDGRPATGTVRNGKLTVPATLVPDQPVTLAVGYHGVPEQISRPSRRGDAKEGVGLRPAANGGAWTMQEPWGAMTWYPANELISDKALYDITVTVPPGWTAVTNDSAAPMPAYLVTLAIDHYTPVRDTGPHGLPLTYWVVPGADDKLLPVLRKSPELLTWLESLLGPYPFETAGAVVNGSVSAMETQQLVSMGRPLSWSVLEQKRYEDTLLHEYAHQWFGDAVTPTTWADLWLNEGFAQYLEYKYQQKKRGYDDATLEQVLRSYDARLRRELGPPGKPSPADFAGSNVYQCGAAMLKELNDALGDDRFWSLMRAWVAGHRYTNQDRAAFIAFVTAHTGEDHSKLINAWLDSPTTPE
ncbi:metallopeptidase [Actinoplanes cyaneus]|uniref:Aminopeptidase N n=2 Tax=Actinoplanes cyaneus TaxID=52696 RepID=A0A919IMU7_9ACTN|nr:Peptidase family M1 [Actinoplanes cyaneus]GID68127.1 metallopeptidase [Actinoplanes cyaneus]